ncbi:hypothetical protein CC78DRAFT_591024 [Lojkania enalia]|uniref:SnoaL-like domain-containing protein n=1 Tax=Lojkania enalia TaxID=147567 RepID=A0A9P4MW71_9PLEO|nr:hypothetical protein CC78DRAFT_591024 [Didymosphaeria enalia]
MPEIDMNSMGPPPTASEFYNGLYATAVEFVHSSDQEPMAPTCINHDRIRAIRSTSGFEHSWGHNYLVSIKPQLSGILDTEGFIRHMGTMTPLLESWDTIITDIFIDETKKTAVVRGSYYMVAKSAPEPIENDLVWFLTFEQDGKRVRKSIEFIDGVASQQLGEYIRNAMKE